MQNRAEMPQASDSAKSVFAACALNVKKSSSNMQNKAETNLFVEG